MAGVTNTDSDRYGHTAEAIWADAGGVLLALPSRLVRWVFLTTQDDPGALPQWPVVWSAAWQTVAG